MDGIEHDPSHETLNLIKGADGVFGRAAVVGITIGVKVKQKSTVSRVECRVFWEQGNPCNCMAL